LVALLMSSPVKNTFGISVFSIQYIFPILLFFCVSIEPHRKIVQLKVVGPNKIHVLCQMQFILQFPVFEKSMKLITT
jgi:hypothetical protein